MCGVNSIDTRTAIPTAKRVRLIVSRAYFALGKRIKVQPDSAIPNAVSACPQREARARCVTIVLSREAIPSAPTQQRRGLLWRRTRFPNGRVLEFKLTVVAIEPVLQWGQRSKDQEQIFIDQAMRVPKLLLGAELTATPDPDAPVTQTNCSSGISTRRFLRLIWRAPRTTSDRPLAGRR